MKKFFIAAFLLPFSLFADFYSDFPSSVNQARLVYFSAPTNSTSVQPDITTNSLFSLYFNHPFGLILNRSSIEYPSYFTNNVQNPNTLAFNQRLNYQLRSSISGSASYYSPLLVPEVRNLFLTAQYLFISGYRGSGFSQYVHYGTRDAFNVDFKLLVSDVLSSTNTVFHRVLLTSLASIDSNIDVLNSSLSSLASDYRSVNFSTFDFLSYLQGIEDNGVISSSQAQAYRQNYDSLSSDPSSQAAFVELAKSSIDSLHRLRNDVQNLYNMSNDPYSREQLNDIGSTINGSVDASINDFKRLSTNWQQGVKQDLQDWRNDVTNRLAHMFDDNIPIDGGNSTPVYVSGQNGGPVSVAGVVRIDQQIPVGVTISAPITIDPTQFNQFSSGWESIVQAVTDFHDYFTSWASNGDIGFGWVRYYSMMYDFSQNTLTNQLAQISLLSSLTNLFANYADNFTNNVIFSISNALAGLTSVSNDYMLLSDYANYINSHGLVDLIDVMDDDTYSALKDELLGISSLDQADSYGRWWRYFTGLETINANSNYKLANLFIGHEKTLNDLKDSSGADSLIDKFQQLFELIPSPTDIMDKTGNMTNSIDRSGFVSLLDQSSSMSNYFNRVEMFFNRGSSLPANISINLGFGNKPGLNNAQPIVLPLDKYRGVMDLLHYGIAFSYCIVNLILLPKFLLILIHLFDRVWKGYDKKLSDAVQA